MEIIDDFDEDDNLDMVGKELKREIYEGKKRLEIAKEMYEIAKRMERNARKSLTISIIALIVSSGALIYKLFLK